MGLKTLYKLLLRKVNLDADKIRGRMFLIRYGWRFGQHGVPLFMQDGVCIRNYGNIYLGNNCRMFRNCLIAPLYMNAGNYVSFGYNGFFAGHLSIGNNVLFGPNCVIPGSNHNWKKKDVLIRKQGRSVEGTQIGDDVWIGGNVSICDGVNICTGCVVGAGSVVVKDLPEYSVAVGNPAKVIKYRN